MVLSITLGSARSSDLPGRGLLPGASDDFFSLDHQRQQIYSSWEGIAEHSLEWHIAAAACAGFAFLLVLMQYSVSEWLYGIE